MTAVAYKPTAYLEVGTEIEFQGVKYLIVKVNPKNYVLARAVYREFSLNRRADIIEGQRNFGWLKEYRQYKIQAREERVGVSTSDENNGQLPNGAPRFKAGQQVQIHGRGAGHYEGVVAYIKKVNRTRYQVESEGTTINVPFLMVRAIV